jgi:hypothetical protein
MARLTTDKTTEAFDAELEDIDAKIAHAESRIAVETAAIGRLQHARKRIAGLRTYLLGDDDSSEPEGGE